MSLQYLRHLSLVVADPSGNGIELGQLRCVFEVRRGDVHTPNSCDVKVYNLSAQTANQIAGPEFTQLSLSAGYGDPSALGLIFRGSIKQVRLGREDQKNSYVAITAADGDESYNFACISETLAAGTTLADSVQGILQNMQRNVLSTPTGGTAGQEITAGNIPPLPPAPFIRGRVHFGMCRDEMSDVARACDCKWSIQDGQVTLIPNTGYVPAAPILITPANGLIGVPEQTQNGIAMTVLLNPSIKIGQTVKLDQSAIQLRPYSLSQNEGAVQSNLALQRSLSGSGIYYVMYAEHSGDTRGQPWYTRLTCLSVNALVTRADVEKSAILPSSAVPRF